MHSYYLARYILAGLFCAYAGFMSLFYPQALANPNNRGLIFKMIAGIINIFPDSIKYGVARFFGVCVCAMGVWMLYSFWVPPKSSAREWSGNAVTINFAMIDACLEKSAPGYERSISVSAEGPAMVLKNKANQKSFKLNLGHFFGRIGRTSKVPSDPCEQAQLILDEALTEIGSPEGVTPDVAPLPQAAPASGGSPFASAPISPAVPAQAAPATKPAATDEPRSPWDSTPTSPAPKPAAAPDEPRSPWESSAPAAAPKTAAPPAPAASPADKAKELERADQSIKDAAARWAEHDYDGAVDAAGKALAIYQKDLPAGDEKIAKTQKMIDRAKEMKAKP